MVINIILFKYSKLIIIFSFFVILFTHFGSVKFYNICKNLISLFMNKKKDKVCICVIGKEENRYIKEYVEHYKKLGVDKIKDSKVFYRNILMRVLFQLLIIEENLQLN